MRSRLLSVCVGGLLGGWATIALAHAVVTKTTLTDHPVRANTATEVTLELNARIESKLTKVTLIDPAGTEQPLALVGAGDPVKVTVALPPLPAGEYILHYKVLAADGHLTENRLRFTVQPSE